MSEWKEDKEVGAMVACGGYPCKAGFNLRHANLRRRHPSAAGVEHLTTNAACDFLGEQRSTSQHDGQESSESVKSYSTD